MRKWIDENTGREIRQLTDLPDGCKVGYFRFPRHLPGGLILAFGKHAAGDLVATEPDSGDVHPIDGEYGGFLGLRESDGRAWFYKPEPDREIWAVDLPDGRAEIVGTLSADAPGHPMEITCDGKTVILLDQHFEPGYPPLPTTRDIRAFWLHSYRPRHGAVWSYNLETNTAVKISELEHMCPSHVDTSPTDPGLIKHCCDDIGLYNPRMWLVRVDGSERREIIPWRQKEWTHHEFWWPDGEHIGYKYMDRRADTTIHEAPWGEYSPMPLQFGICDLNGREVYKSDPLCCYQSHIFVSPDGTWVCGEGTDGHSFAYAAPFSMSMSKVDFRPHATIHTPYIPSAAQGVETGFSADNKWLIYNDTVDGRLQVCAVRVDE